jgi:hypothetical protein
MPLARFDGVAFTTTGGLALAPNAALEIRRESDSGLASIFEDRDGLTGITQPGFEADSEGAFFFYAAGLSGGYSVQSTSGAEVRLLNNQAIGTAQERDASDYGATIMDAANAAAARALLDVYSEAEVDALLPESATTDAEGLVELATQAEADAGTAGKVLTADLNRIALGTPADTTSGTEFDYTIPAGVREIIIPLAGVSLDGTDDILVQLGDAEGVENTGYVSTSQRLTTAGSSVSSSTAGFVVASDDPGNTLSGHILLTLIDPATFRWSCSHNVKVNATQTVTGGGDKTLSAELTTVRITRSGTNNFDAGVLNACAKR